MEQVRNIKVIKPRQHENELLRSTLNRFIELKSCVTKSKSEIVEIDEEILKESDAISYFTRLLNNQTTVAI